MKLQYDKPADCHNLIRGHLLIAKFRSRFGAKVLLLYKCGRVLATKKYSVIDNHAANHPSVIASLVDTGTMENGGGLFGNVARSTIIRRTSQRQT